LESEKQADTKNKIKNNNEKIVSTDTQYKRSLTLSCWPATTPLPRPTPVL